MKVPADRGQVDADRLPLPGMTRIGFDTSSLNRLDADPAAEAVCASLADHKYVPLLSAITIVEIMKWSDHEARDRLLATAAHLRRVADYRLLPFPNEVVEGWFIAWLTNQFQVTFGGERIAEAMQDLLERAEARHAELPAAAMEYARAEERSFAARIQSVRMRAAQLPPEVTPLSAADFLMGLFARRESLAAMLNAWFGSAMRGHPLLTPDEAFSCLHRLPVLRAYFISLGLAAYRHGVLGRSLRRGAAGVIDVSQAALLPLVDCYIVDDGHMHIHLREVVQHGALDTRIVRYDELRDQLGIGGAPPTRNLKQERLGTRAVPGDPLRRDHHGRRDR